MDLAARVAFNEAVRAAKAAEADGDLAAALAAYERAGAHHMNEQLEKKTQYLRRKLLGAENVAPATSTRPPVAAKPVAAPAPAPASMSRLTDAMGRLTLGGAAGGGLGSWGGFSSLGTTAAATAGGSSGSEAGGGDWTTTLRTVATTGAPSGITAAGGRGVGKGSSVRRGASGPALTPHALDAVTKGPSTVVADGLRMPAAAASKLYGYQREGVAWMWSTYPRGPTVGPAAVHGGILADDMGLGKTVQVAAFIAALFHSRAARTACIVAPVSVVPVWERELATWAPGIPVKVFHGTAAATRERAVAAICGSGGVLITTYGMVANSSESLGAAPAAASDAAGGGDGMGDGDGSDSDELSGESEDSESEDGGRAADSRGGKTFATPSKRAGDGKGAGARTAPRSTKAKERAAALLAGVHVAWDALVLDEGHKVKNPNAEISRTVRRLPARYRLLLSGTPVQNNLDELWALLDFTAEGRLLGSARAFNNRFASVIVRARDRMATEADKEAGAAASEELTSLIRPYILRREKDVVLGCSTVASAGMGTLGGLAGVPAPAAAGGGVPAAPASTSGGAALTATITEKREIVVWTRMAAAQAALYEEALDSDGVKAALYRRLSPLAALTMLKQLCTHPILRTGTGPGLAALMRGMEAKAPAGDGSEPGATSMDLSAMLEDEEAGVEGESAGGSGKRGVEWCAGALPSAATMLALSGKLQLLVPLVKHLLLGSGAPGVDGASADAGTIPPDLWGALAEAPDGSAPHPAPATAPSAGHKVLIFSQSARMLDVIDATLRRRVFGLDAEAEAAATHGGGEGAVSGSVIGAAAVAGSLRSRWSSPILRIDGSVTDMAIRNRIVDSFNADPRYRICLLTTGVGGVGLTLTGASRVIIFDPSWNPAVEQQAVDRAYRIGQTRDVVTYRLIATGTVEEKMYRLQVFKGGLSSSIMSAAATSATRARGAHDATRFLTRGDMAAIFTLGNTQSSETKELLDSMTRPPIIRSADIRRELISLFTTHLAGACAGYSHHDHLFIASEGAAARAAETPAAAAASEDAEWRCSDDGDSEAPVIAPTPDDAAPAVALPAQEKRRQLDGGRKRQATPDSPFSPSPRDRGVGATAVPAAAVPAAAPVAVAKRRLIVIDSDDEEEGEEGAALCHRPQPAVAASGDEVGAACASTDTEPFLPAGDAGVYLVATATASEGSGIATATPCACADDAGVISCTSDSDGSPPHAVADVARRLRLGSVPTSPAAAATGESDTPHAAAAAVCVRHGAACARLGLDVASLKCCPCGLSPASADLVSYALTAEAAVTGSDEATWRERLELVMCALAICDGEPALHVAAMRAGGALGWLRAAATAAGDGSAAGDDA